MEVAMIYRGNSPHPAHAGFAESVGADLIGLNTERPFLNRYSITNEIVDGLLVDEYDVYIAEGTRAMYGAIASQILNDSSLVYLAGDQAIYKLINDSYEHQSFLNRAINKYGMTTLRKLFDTYVDGVIAVSEFSAGYTHEIIPDKPTKVANPYIQPKLYEKLGKVDPSLDQNIAVTVGSFARYKGQDILVDAWPIVREKHPEAELLLIGSDYPEHFEEVEGVSVLGYVEDLATSLSEASLYVQPSRMDNFPVSVLEAMRAGIPPVVTETTGNKVEVQQVNEELVIEPTAEHIAQGVINYFDKPTSARKRLSTAARQRGNQFDSETRKHIFRERFHELLSEIDP